MFFFVLYILEMFQSELTLELDRILKSQLLSQTRALNGSDVSVLGTVAESSFEVIAKEHDDNTRPPSDVLIDIKDTVKAIILKDVNPEKGKVKNLLQETKVILERRQVKIGLKFFYVLNVYTCIPFLILHIPKKAHGLSTHNLNILKFSRWK